MCDMTHDMTHDTRSHFVRSIMTHSIPLNFLRFFVLGILFALGAYASFVSTSSSCSRRRSPLIPSVRLFEQQQQQQQQQLQQQQLQLQQQPPQEWEGFNPLARTGAGSVSSAGGLHVQQLLSMRKIHMQELTQEIMREINNKNNNSDDDNSDARILARLENAREFLLEPLESQDSVMDPDSIFDPGMSRSERFTRYRTVMTERIGLAKNQSLKKLLQSMMDYVLQFE